MRKYYIELYMVEYARNSGLTKECYRIGINVERDSGFEQYFFHLENLLAVSKCDFEQVLKRYRGYFTNKPCCKNLSFPYRENQYYIEFKTLIKAREFAEYLLSIFLSNKLNFNSKIEALIEKDIF